MIRDPGGWTDPPPLVDAVGMVTSIGKSRLLIGGVVVLILIVASWALSTREATADAGSGLMGRDWSQATASWGLPLCRAAGVRVTARESAARRASGESSLVVPHAELVVMDPSSVHGRGSRVSNRMLIFTEDPEVRAFIDRHVAGDLAAVKTETRVAIDRARPVRLVEIDPYERIVAIQTIRPVFVTVPQR